MADLVLLLSWLALLGALVAGVWLLVLDVARIGRPQPSTAVLILLVEWCSIYGASRG